MIAPELKAHHRAKDPCVGATARLSVPGAGRSDGVAGGTHLAAHSLSFVRAENPSPPSALRYLGCMRRLCD
jgi:hypothetical protein